jgi:hypothetical protein
MLRLISDQNFNGPILRGLLRRQPDLDLVRAFDVELATAADPVLLAWAAEEGRILLSHDVNTVPGFAHDRVRRGEPMPGVFLVSDTMPIGQAITELLFVIRGSTQQEWAGFVTYFPM